MLHVGAFELVIAGNGLVNHGHIQHDAPVIDLLVKVVIGPFGLSYREFGELVLYGHFGFHILEVVGFEGFPLLWGIGRIMAKCTAVFGFGRSAEVADEVFALFQLLLLQTKNSAHTLQ